MILGNMKKSDFLDFFDETNFSGKNDLGQEMDSIFNLSSAVSHWFQKKTRNCQTLRMICVAKSIKSIQKHGWQSGLTPSCKAFLFKSIWPT